MRILVTGASGFLGRSVVEAAQRSGHSVIALVRPTAELDPAWVGDVEVIRGDLRELGAWTQQLSGVEGIIHLAASPSGDLHTQMMGTVVATENLLEHLPFGSIRRFVHVSTFSVYDYKSIRTGGLLDETAPLENNLDERDAYTLTKTLQEKMVREACDASNTPLIVIRPGAIFGAGKDWDHGRALRAGRFDIIFAPGARMRLTYVTNCAEAIICALHADTPSGSTFNIVDDDAPTHRQFYRAAKRSGATTGIAVYVPWVGVLLLGQAARLANRMLFSGRAKLPELLSLRRQHARWKPLRYENSYAREKLGWRPSSLTDHAQKTADATEQARPDVMKRHK